MIKGTMPNIDAGDTVKAVCRWVYTEKYGWQLDCLTASKEIPTNIKEIKKFLIRNVKGIGEVTAKKIVDKYGTESISILAKEPDRVMKELKMSKSRISSIEKEVSKCYEMENLTEYLFSIGFTNYEYISKVYSKLKNNALNLVKASPYNMLDVLPAEAFKEVDASALSWGCENNSPERVGEMIKQYLKYESISNGNTFVYYINIVQDMYLYYQKMDIPLEGITQITLDAAICEFEGKYELKRVSDKEDKRKDRIYLRSYYDIEKESAEILRELNVKKRSVNEKKFNKFINEYEKAKGIELDEEQKRAVKMAYENGVFILTGYPGTGKTLTVNAIIRYIKHEDAGAVIGLVAPTGRASKRLTELTGSYASTIHKLLRISDDDNALPQIKTIEADYLICDESSMIDSRLFHSLLSVLRENKVSLILVGDKDQLPPVGAGLPFKDMIESGIFPTVRLEKLFRQANESQINRNAKTILKGLAPGEELMCDETRGDFAIYEQNSPEDTLTCVVNEVLSLIKSGENPDDIAVLSPMKKSIIGVENLNNILQSVLNPPGKNKREKNFKTYTLREGDKVMQIKNNYDLCVFNGDMGRILSINEEEKEIKVSYEETDGRGNNLEKIITYDYELLNQLTLAYAMTVHKSQGSEFANVIFPVSPIFTNLAKNIIYTAVTRAKKHFVTVGSKKSLYAGINKLTELKRNTSMIEFVKEQKRG